MTHNRIIGIDIIKTLAIFCVIAGHFFVLNTPFKSVPFEGVSMFIQGVFYEFFLIGVPLFIIATGVLQSSKTISKQFYFKAINVILSYLFFSLLAILFRLFYLEEEMTIFQAIDGIFRFTVIPYSWYIEMWIGLFLLIPFLNILYKSLGSKRKKQILLLTIYILTALPNCFNRFDFHIFPDFWISIWPLLYYFIGSYLKEYSITYSTHKTLLCLFLICIINPIFNILYAPNHDYISLIDNQLLMPILSGGIFVLCLNIKNVTKTACNFFAFFSNRSLDIYLCCWFFDVLLYPFFKNHFYHTQAQFGCFFFLIVPLVFILSSLMAQCKQVLFSIGSFCFKKMVKF